MTRPFQQWTVLPHGKVAQIDDNILTVVGTESYSARPHDALVG